MTPQDALTALAADPGQSITERGAVYVPLSRFLDAAGPEFPYRAILDELADRGEPATYVWRGARAYIAVDKLAAAIRGAA